MSEIRARLLASSVQHRQARAGKPEVLSIQGPSAPHDDAPDNPRIPREIVLFGPAAGRFRAELDAARRAAAAVVVEADGLAKAKDRDGLPHVWLHARTARIASGALDVPCGADAPEHDESLQKVRR